MQQQQFNQPPPVQAVPQPPPKPQGPLDVDALVIPTMLSGAGQNQMSEYPEGHEQNTNDKTVEELNLEDRKNQGPLIDSFGEMAVRKLMSKTWQNREEALNEIEDALTAGTLNEDEGFVSGVGAVKATVADKMAGVSPRSMLLMNTICGSFDNVNLDSNARSQFTSYSDPIITTLVEKLGDNLQKIRVSAEDALMNAAGHREFGVRMVLSYLISDAPPKVVKGAKGPPKKATASNKLMIAKYQFLTRLLQSYDFSRDQ